MNSQLELDLPDTPPQLPDVRRSTGGVLADLDIDQADDAFAVTVELVWNAYAHAVGPRRISIRHVPDRGVLRVEVVDHTPGRLPVLGRLAATGIGGRGLLIVNRLASKWGYKRGREDKTVWAEVPIHGE